jgi:hypothetical protein
MISADIIEQFAAGEIVGRQYAAFRLPRKNHLTREIAAAWTDARAYWEAFQRVLRRFPEDDPTTAVTHEHSSLLLLRSLGCEQVIFMPRAAVVGSGTYVVSDRAGPGENATPAPVAGARAGLDRLPSTGRPRLPPHDLVQECLNRAAHLWGIVTNGRPFRLLCGFALMARPSYATNPCWTATRCVTCSWHSLGGVPV